MTIKSYETLPKRRELSAGYHLYGETFLTLAKNMEGTYPHVFASGDFRVASCRNYVLPILSRAKQPKTRRQIGFVFGSEQQLELRSKMISDIEEFLGFRQHV